MLDILGWTIIFIAYSVLGFMFIHIIGVFSRHYPFKMKPFLILGLFWPIALILILVRCLNKTIEEVLDKN